MAKRLEYKNHATMAEIVFFKGRFHLKIKGLFSALFAKYSGDFDLRSIAGGFTMKKGSKTFMITSKCARELDGDLLFTYYGVLDLRSVKLYTYRGDILRPTITIPTNSISSESGAIESLDTPVEDLQYDKGAQFLDANFIKLKKKKKMKKYKLKHLPSKTQVRGGQSGAPQGGGGGGGY